MLQALARKFESVEEGDWTNIAQILGVEAEAIKKEAENIKKENDKNSTTVIKLEYQIGPAGSQPTKIEIKNLQDLKDLLKNKDQRSKDIREAMGGETKDNLQKIIDQYGKQLGIENVPTLRRELEK
ncbi:MAG: hypothetical protein HQL69_17505 [Magnetococcales bacterium]|nr:hypothetical protein [Magnetococcales bacterium]